MTIVPLVPKDFGAKSSLTRNSAARNAGTGPSRAAVPPEIQTADLGGFRAALRHLAGGVSVVTTGRGASRTGLVATRSPRSRPSRRR
ncbi:hypothetical protein [Bosea minatitlanensis]|uniref:Uncharacterized protein n=1 Tax=Bosea minatitlanensis TaxID=128782 RepID=A0ABW0F465_9HYPH|nr:hypothetical protein [Bosea minatitlanensis]MCT4495594.1 hypothetical protein [Bosea minatitlanensis]